MNMPETMTDQAQSPTPSRVRDQLSPTPAHDPHKDLDQSVILIVDDNIQNLELLQAYLESLPCAIATAHDGIEAMKYLEDSDLPLPDLVLLDVMMPGMDGPSTLQALRAIPSLAETPVIFMTAKAQAHEIEHYKALGALDVITKPFDPMQLSQQIHRIWNTQ